jgi:hypothetical protein
MLKSGWVSLALNLSRISTTLGVINLKDLDEE